MRFGHPSVQTVSVTLLGLDCVCRRIGDGVLQAVREQNPFTGAAQRLHNVKMHPGGAARNVG
jgi:hypothetical protein